MFYCLKSLGKMINKSDQIKMDMETDNAAVSYVEEKALGENLQIGGFNDATKELLLISNTNVLSFNAQTGAWTRVYPHSDPVIGIHFQGDKMFAYTKLPQLILWDLHTGEEIAQKSVKMHEQFKPTWLYSDAGGRQFILGVHENQESVLFHLQIDDSTFLQNCLKSSGNAKAAAKGIQANPILQIGDQRPGTRDCFAIGPQFCVKCEGKTLHWINFKEQFGAAQEDVWAREKLPKTFTLDSKFDVANPELVEFSQVQIARDCLYAAVNIGRVYVWTKLTEFGISPINNSHVTLSGNRPTICVSAHGSVFIGSGKGLLYKYNMNASSGTGRWNKLEYLQLEAPTRAMALNEDCTQLAVLCADNSVCSVQTAGMTQIASVQTLNASQVRDLPAYGFDMAMDPANPSLLVTNARFGCIQWVDPFQWKTAKTFDVAEENVPHEDTFNKPNRLWLNTYLVDLSLVRLVTCECRRDSPEKTFLKFWRRTFPNTNNSMADSNFELEDCFVLDQRVHFLRSTLDECSDMEEARMQADHQEFLCIDARGRMGVYVKDMERRGHWRCDLQRVETNWQQCRVKCCSRIRDHRFATVLASSTGQSTHVVVWDLRRLGVEQVIDCLKDANQAEWLPQPNTLLISCKAGIVAFNTTAKEFVWVVLEPECRISSNAIATFAYRQQKVFPINPETGALFGNVLEFSGPQNRVIALKRGNDDGPSFCGISEQGTFTLLKPKPQTEEEPFTTIKWEKPAEEEDQPQPQTAPHKSTAFSQLLMDGKRKAAEENNNELTNGQQKPLLKVWRTVPVTKFVDGPAYALAPIKQLAQNFFEACLGKR